MDKHIPEFTPEQVDAQVDWLLTRQAPASPDDQIISGLHQMYQDDERSLNNVRQRLGLEQDQACNRETQQLPWEKTPTAQLPASANVLDLKRKRSMRQLIETTHATRQSAQRPPARVFSLLTAVCVAALLVGSMALVFSLLRGNAPSTGVGSHDPGAGVIGLVPTTTPIVHPECRDGGNKADEALCLQHKETILNITRTFGTHQVTFVRAYADISRLMLIYTTADSPHSDVISFESLTIQQKITLGGGSSHSYTNPQTHQEYYVLNFDTQSIPAGTTELHIQSIVDDFSGKATPLNFTLPLNMIQKTVSVNKTVTSKGVSLTLERLVIVGYTTLIYVEPSSPPISSLFVDTISVNGHPLILPLIYNGGQTDSGGTVGSPAVAIRLDALLDAPGSWTLKVNEGGYTWTFSFAVPAN